MLSFRRTNKRKVQAPKIQQAKDLSLILLTVLLFYLSFPGGNYPWVAWVALVPVGIALHDRTCREAFTIMASMALFGWMAATWWVVPGVAKVVSSSPLVVYPFAIIFCLLYAVPYGIAGMVYSRMGWTSSISGAVKSAFVWTAICCLVPHILPGNIAHSQYLYPRVIQITDIGGIPLLFFVIHWFNWLLVTAFINLEPKPIYAAKALSLALLIPVLVLVYGESRLEEVHELSAAAETPRIQVGWLQPNLGIKGRNRSDWERESVKIEAMSQQILSRYPNLDLLVWPEIPPPVSYLEWEQDRILIDRLLSNTRTALFVTGHHGKFSGDNKVEGNGYYNVVEYISAAGKPEIYRKQYLLPFAEYLPGEIRFPLLRQLFPGALHYLAGKESRVFSLGAEVKVIPLICYEAVFPELVRSAWEQGGNLIVNPVDDAWFGKTAGAAVHLALAVFRAVEFRIPLVRATNSGISALVTAAGEIDADTITPMHEANTMVTDVMLPQIDSIYASYGNWFLWLSAAIAVLSLLLDGKRIFYLKYRTEEVF